MSFFIRRPDPARCHNCGERVTPYAAGCWLCGAALDPERSQRPSGLFEHVVARWRKFVARRDS
jgi:predicted amidophosphoribosyltransferase